MNPAPANQIKVTARGRLKAGRVVIPCKGNKKLADRRGVEGLAKKRIRRFGPW